MSCYITTRRHFDSIAAGMKELLISRDFSPPDEVKRHIPQVGVNRAFADMKRVDELVARLADIQIISVCYRYPSERGIPVAIADQREIMGLPSRRPLTLQPVPLLKAIDCALYQIDTWQVEKDHPLTTEERDCLDFFAGFRAYLMEYIIKRLPAYSNAAWHIT